MSDQPRRQNPPLTFYVPEEDRTRITQKLDEIVLQFRLKSRSEIFRKLADGELLICLPPTGPLALRRKQDEDEG